MRGTHRRAPRAAARIGFGGGTGVVFIRLHQRAFASSSVPGRVPPRAPCCSDWIACFRSKFRRQGSTGRQGPCWNRNHGSEPGAGAGSASLHVASGESNRWVWIRCGAGVGRDQSASRVESRTNWLVRPRARVRACCRRACDGTSVLFLHCPGSRPDGARGKKKRFVSLDGCPSSTPPIQHVIDRPSTLLLFFFFKKKSKCVPFVLTSFI